MGQRAVTSGENEAEEKANPDVLVTPNPSSSNFDVGNVKQEPFEHPSRELCVTPPSSVECKYDPHTPTPFKEKIAELELGVKPLVRVDAVFRIGISADFNFFGEKRGAEKFGQFCRARARIRGGRLNFFSNSL